MYSRIFRGALIVAAVVAAGAAFAVWSIGLVRSTIPPSVEPVGVAIVTVLSLVVVGWVIDAAQSATGRWIEAAMPIGAREA